MRTGAVVLAALLTLPAFAADPNQKRGFSANEVYQIGDIDHVNVFNGNVVVNIPIGQSYRVGPDLQYQFRLTYNSKIWDYKIEDFSALNCVQDNLPCSLRYGIPESTSTAGFGWTVSLGRLVLPRLIEPAHGWIYIGPDGAEHELQQIISPAPTPPPHPMNIVRARTEDLSYLELRRDDAAKPQIRFPDGQIHTFDASGRLTKIEDRYCNWVKVAYTPTQWTVTDGYSDGNDCSVDHVARTHYVNFIDKSALYTEDEPNFEYVISSVDLAAFDSTPENPPGTGDRAVFQFTYDDRWVGRGGGGNRLSSDETKATLCLTAPFLNRVLLPDGTSYEPAYKTFGDAALPKPSACIPAPNDPYSVLESDWGIIQSLNIPTGGSIQWAHGAYPMNLQSCLNGAGYATLYVGVRSRIFKDRSGGELMKWTYTPALTPLPAGAELTTQTCEGQFGTIPAPREELTNIVEISSGPVDAGGTKLQTKNFFSVFPDNGLVGAGNQTPRGFRRGEYGRPFTHNQTVGSGAGLRLLSTEVSDCTGNCDALQRNYVLYETDPLSVSAGRSNPRVVAERTVDLKDAAGWYTDTQHSEWDGFGHYQKSVTTSSAPQTPVKTTFTDYLPDSTNWLLNLYGESWVQQGTGSTAQAAQSITTFDGATGMVHSVRTLKATGPDPASLGTSGADLLSVSCRGSRGFVTSERYFGGDTGGLPSGSPCSALRAAGNYFLNHSYTFSGAALTGHQAQYAGTSHFVTDEVFDANTGMVRIARDSAGTETVFAYDSSGRATSVAPHGRVETTYTYSPSATPPFVAVSQECPSGPDASPCTQEMLTGSRYYFDDLGRLSQELRSYTTTDWAATWITYDAVGRKKTVSVPVQSNASPSAQPANTPVTTWTYDVLGRPTRETRPDLTYSKWTYAGKRETSRYAGGPPGSDRLRSKEIANGLGQLVEVHQRTASAASAASDVVTSYQYDVGGRLSSVRMVAPGGATQTRLFDYDGRGFLRWQSQPESGMTAYQYDSRAHVTEKDQSAANSQFDLRYVYDPAERLVTLSARNPLFGEPGQPMFRVMKELGYGPANETNDLRKGKLVTAARYNYPTPNYGADTATYKIEDTYKYGDPSGRRTLRTTTISRAEWGEEFWQVKSIDTGVTWNALDLPERMQYPTCLNCGAPNVSPDRTGMTYAYSRGRLQSIAGFVSAMTYWPSGLRNLLAHSNGITDQQQVDGMPRPSKIAFFSGDNDPVGRCQQPAFTSQPASTNVASPGGNATLSVVAGGTGPFQYEWIRVSDFASIGTTQSITVHVTATDEFYVVVKNPCGFEESQRAKVKVGGCDIPTIRGIEPIRQPDGNWLLQPDVMATQQRQFTWTRLSDSAQIGQTATVLVPAPVGSPATYRLALSDSCGSTTQEVTLTPAPAITTTGLVATVTGPNQVSISWPAAFNVSSYVVERRSGAQWEQIAAGLTSPSHMDNTVALNRTYAYRAYAVRSNLKSNYSNSDVATTGSFTPAVSGQKVNVAAFSGMLAAVNSVRAAVGWTTPLTWANILASTDPVPEPLALVVERHITAARSRMNEALSALGVPLRDYTNRNLSGVRIGAVHVNEIEQRAQ
jgi:hypothetical protein